MLFLKKQKISPFLCHRSAASCQIDSNKVSNSELKPNLYSCVKAKIIESTAPPQQPHKRGTTILRHLVDILTIWRRESFSIPYIEFYIQLS